VKGREAVKKIEKLIGRRNFLIAGGAASTLALAPMAGAAGKAADAGCGASTTIKGLNVDKPVHTPTSMSMMPVAFAGGGAPGGGAPGGGAGSPGAAGGGALGAGAAGGGTPSMADGGPPTTSMSAVPAIRVVDGKYLAEKSSTSAASAGKVTDKYSSGAKIAGKSADVGGVYVTGLGSEYILADATINLDGDGPQGLGGTNCGAGADDHATLIIRNCTINTTGTWRAATAVNDHSVLKVYNSTLKASGVPFKPDFTTTGQKTQLEIDGNSRCHVTLSNSYSYFYYSTIIAEGWAALSTDSSDGFTYLEANDCTVKTITSGYGTYADGGCHNVINRCSFDVADMVGIIAGEADISFTDTKAKCGTYFALIHSFSAGDVGTLKVIGGEIETKKPVILTKSANTEILLQGVKVKSDSGVLIRTTMSVDPHAAAAANTKGQKVYGVHATLKDMEVSGDILHEDKASREMTIYLEAATLKGAIKDANIKMNRLSKWFATKDSNVTIIGDVDVSQIDAPAGVTITAVAAQSGTHKLASCGTLVLKTA
jgi:hypothetical protein